MPRRFSSAIHATSMYLTRWLFRYAGLMFPGLLARWGVRLWGKVHRLPWRAWETLLLDESRQEIMSIDGEKVYYYRWGEGTKKILLIHGWNSRASHFRNYIDALTRLNYQVIGFDAIGHGNSSGRWTSVIDYQAIVKSINDKYGPFEAVIGHSFGGFCIPYALNHGLQARCAILIATPDTLGWLFDRFTGTVHAPQRVREAMMRLIERRFGSDCWQRYSVPQNASRLAHTKALIMHDKNDIGVPIALAEHNHEAWPQSEMLVTRKLGHHRILRHSSAIRPVIEFIKED